MIAAATLLAGCDSRQDRARAIYDQFQAAQANGDLRGARKALQALVAIDDSVSDYWVQLGKIELQLADFGAAYGALSRAHELDQANVNVLQLLTQLELRADSTEAAERTAHELEILSPDDPTVHLTFGYVALKRGDLDEATKQVDLLLADYPNDSSAKILQSRIAFATGDPDRSAAILLDQLRTQPSDQVSLEAFLNLAMLRQRWPEAMWAARRLLIWKPIDVQVRAKLIESDIRGGDLKAALSDTLSASEKSNSKAIDDVLEPWLETGIQDRVSGPLFTLAQRSRGERRVAFARFFAAAGDAPRVIALLQDQETSPITVGNLSAGALYAWAVGASGKRDDAMARLDKVLAVDPDNSDGLTNRARLRSLAGDYQGGIEDANRLVASSPGSVEARLLLSRTMLRARRTDDAQRVLWDAFHVIPANLAIYDALRTLLVSSGDNDAVRRLSDEFHDQSLSKMSRSF